VTQKAEAVMPTVDVQCLAGLSSVQVPRIQEKREDVMNVEVKEMPAYHVAFVRHIGPYPEIGGAFEKLFRWAGPTGVMGPGATVLGAYWDDPGETPAAELRSAACVTIASGTKVGEGIETQTLPVGNFAVCRCEIFDNDFKSAWESLLREWFPKSGLTMRPAACYEIYHNNAMEDPERKWIIDICVPVE
jgi:AraC family transcriptional regulator